MLETLTYDTFSIVFGLLGKTDKYSVSKLSWAMMMKTANALNLPLACFENMTRDIRENLGCPHCKKVNYLRDDTTCKVCVCLRCQKRNAPFLFVKCLKHKYKKSERPALIFSRRNCGSRTLGLEHEREIISQLKTIKREIGLKQVTVFIKDTWHSRIPYRAYMFNSVYYYEYYKAGELHRIYSTDGESWYVDSRAMTILCEKCSGTKKNYSLIDAYEIIG